MPQSVLPKTETLHDSAKGLDIRSGADIAATILSGQQAALKSVETSLPDLVRGADLMVDTVRRGGRLIYAAAGSSGLMALADAAELTGTYGLSPDLILFFMAGGVPVDGRMPGHTEDQADAAERDAAAVRPGDVVIAVTASGSTPYPTAFAKKARTLGASTICVANNGDADIFVHADVAVALETPPEIIAGSTRLGAATAQKAALNTMSTLMGVRLGHVYDGMMVNLVADNRKLRARAAGMVSRIAHVDKETATRSLEQSKWAVKPAVLLAAGASSLDRAETLLAETQGQLRKALQRI
ncbi:N-acetylmuramic acid 6-phosphate etherase [Rhodobacterales bacterium]|nr:N-acetylmuramic acid 6-phosphate etherase [Rhodobacterales bacterium]